MAKRNLGKQFSGGDFKTGQVGIDLPMFVDAEELADFAVADYSTYGWSNDEMHTALHGTPAPADVDRGQLLRDFKLRESQMPMVETSWPGGSSVHTPHLVNDKYDDGSGTTQLDHSLYDAIEQGKGTFTPVNVGISDSGKRSFEDGYHRTLSAADIAKKQGRQRFVPVNYVEGYDDDED